MGSLISAALARAQGFLVEPAAEIEQPSPQAPVLVLAEPRGSIQVAVTGLSRRSGATTVAAGLAHALAAPGVRSGHLVSLYSTACAAPPGVARWELPPALSDPGEVADYGATLARVAAGGEAAAVVWDVPADEVDRAAGVMQACDAVVCVADASAEPALCHLVCEMLAERFGRVLLVANRVRDEHEWSLRCAATLPESRLAAALVGRGRAAGGGFGSALARLAAAVEERA